MDKNSGKFMVGAFVLGAIALVVVGIVVFGSGALFAEKNVFVLHFSGSVKGLNVGSPVVLRGVKIGAVKDIRINAASVDHPFSIPVLIEINKDCVVMQGDSSGNQTIEETLDALIKQGLRAKLEMQSLVTGQLLVALDFEPDTTPRFSGLESSYLEIPTTQSDIEELTSKLKQAPIEEIFNKVFSIISNVDTFLNSESINELLVAMTAALNSINGLAAHMDNELPDLSSNLVSTVSDAKKFISTADKEVVDLSLSLKKAIADIQNLVAVALSKVNSMGAGVDETVVSAQNLLAGIHQEVAPVSSGLQDVLKSARNTMISAQKASDQATEMLKGIDRITDSDSALLYNLNTTLAEISDAARSVRMLAEYIERHPEAFIQGKQ
ncbi:MlaD family protein [Desulfamplus magnetovallimortis]|nr:MlaD family protein [Desulfamplus magnetovallimortis]